MASPAVSSAVSSDSLEIPLVDFSAFLSGDGATKQSTAQAILSGFQEAGFVYLKNHGITAGTVAETFAASARFFARPPEEKEALAWTTPRANRGYSQPGREKTTDLTAAEEIAAQRSQEGGDLKESFEIGRDDDPDFPNRWPSFPSSSSSSEGNGEEESDAAFRQRMLAFHTQCKELHLHVMRAVAVGMMGSGAEKWFDPFCDGGDNTLRLLHYPAVAAGVFRDNPRAVRAGAHTDYGSITLLFQDGAGGLQVLSPRGNFVDATPIEDTIVVNAGDLLARWSNDTIRSTKHRVVEPPIQADVHPDRYSIAYFCNPNFDRFIDAIPGTYDEVRGKKYEGVNSGEYLEQRLAATY